MENTPQRDTPPERALRSELHRRGLRFRVDLSVSETSRLRPDVVFTGPRVVVFVDGCFWHRCPEHGSVPKANRAWWDEKLSENVRRDRRHDSVLKSEGWTVIRVWEHEDPAEAADRIVHAVRGETDA